MIIQNQTAFYYKLWCGGLTTLFVLGAGIFFEQVEAADFVMIEKISPSSAENIFYSPQEEISVKILPESVSGDTYLRAMSLVPQNEISVYFNLPDGREPASDLYLVKFSPWQENYFSQPPQVSIKYIPDDKYKEVYCYDWSDLRFQKMAGERDTLNKLITYNWSSVSRLCAIFNEPELVGMASWYVHPRYRGELMAASRDFAKGSKVKVQNLYNNKEVTVTILDYGPKKCADWTEKEHELMGPCRERILDLSKTAFLKLATSTGQGIISQIKIIPLE